LLEVILSKKPLEENVDMQSDICDDFACLKPPSGMPTDSEVLAFRDCLEVKPTLRENCAYHGRRKAFMVESEPNSSHLCD